MHKHVDEHVPRLPLPLPPQGLLESHPNIEPVDIPPDEERAEEPEAGAPTPVGALPALCPPFSLFGGWRGGGRGEERWDRGGGCTRTPGLPLQSPRPHPPRMPPPPNAGLGQPGRLPGAPGRGVEQLAEGGGAPLSLPCSLAGLGAGAYLGVEDCLGKVLCSVGGRVWGAQRFGAAQV